MKKIITVAFISAALMLPAFPSHASWFGRVSEYAIGDTLGNILSDIILDGIHGRGNSSSEESTPADSHAAKWETVGSSDGGDTYFNTDTLSISEDGGRKVTAEMANFFTDRGSRSLKSAAGSRVKPSKTIAYSLYKVTFEENTCYVDGKVTYYDEDGNKLFRTSAEDALPDITQANYGNPYAPGSMELKAKEKVFSIAYPKSDSIRDGSRKGDSGLFKPRPAEDSPAKETMEATDKKNDMDTVIKTMTEGSKEEKD